LVEAGEVEIELNYAQAECTTLYGLLRTTKNYKVVLPDNAEWAFTGYMKSFEPCDAKMEDKMAMKASFKVSGLPDFTAST
jgi:hypothetical protein